MCHRFYFHSKLWLYYNSIFLWLSSNYYPLATRLWALRMSLVLLQSAYMLMISPTSKSYFILGMILMNFLSCCIKYLLPLKTRSSYRTSFSLFFIACFSSLHAGRLQRPQFVKSMRNDWLRLALRILYYVCFHKTLLVADRWAISFRSICLTVFQ